MDVKITAIVEECKIRNAIFATNEITVDILLGDRTDEKFDLPKIILQPNCGDP